MISFNRICRLAICLVSISTSVPSHAHDVPASWKTECIGRYQISVPGEVEVALTRPKKFPINSRLNLYTFEDGTRGEFSEMYIEGGLYISYPITSDEVGRIVKAEQRITNEAVAEYIQDGDRETAKNLRRLHVNAKDAYAWRGGDRIDLYLVRDNRLFLWRGKSDDGYTGTEAIMHRMMATLRPRDLYEIPKEPGFCFPYGFIPNNGKASQWAGVTMRLKDHPDVEIFFMEQPDTGHTFMGSHRNSREKLEFFWEFNYANGEKKLRYHWPKFRDVKIDAREGDSTTVEITRNDDSRDPGYAAFVEGDPNAPYDTPNLVLYVIRTASLAKGKPVSENEFRDMAHQITASIRRRIP